MKGDVIKLSWKRWALMIVFGYLGSKFIQFMFGGSFIAFSLGVFFSLVTITLIFYFFDKSKNKSLIMSGFIFLGILFLTILFTNIVTAVILPIKPVVLTSESMFPTYQKGEILFYTSYGNYQINDVILYQPPIAINPIIVRIISENPNSTFVVKGDNIDTNPEPITFLDQYNVEINQIEGKVIWASNPLLYYVIIYAVQIVLALYLTILFSIKN